MSTYPQPGLPDAQLALDLKIVRSPSEGALDALAELLAPRIEPRLSASKPEPDGWMDAKSAARYLGISLHALHKLTAARAIPFHQDGPGCKCWFKRSELDAWRAGDKPSRRVA